MDSRAWHLRRRDIVVLTLCAVILISTLGAVGEGGRRRAKEMVCQSNLHQWAGIFQGYIEPNDGTFVSGGKARRGYWWVEGTRTRGQRLEDG